jgi:hypothetical protein
MNYTKSEPYNIKCPTQFNVPYYPNLKNIDTRDVFKYERLDEPIIYPPFGGDVPMGDVMERTFHKKCPKKSNNAFFYPENVQEFFKKNTEMKKIYGPCKNLLWYNTTLNMADDKRHSEILSSPCCTIDSPQASPGFSQKTRAYSVDPECFFKNNQLQSSFHNYAQTEPLRKDHKYISSYDNQINRVSCEDLPCKSSHKHSTAL